MQERNVRDIILQELTSSPKTWSELLSAVTQIRSVSETTFFYHLRKLLRDNRIEKVVNEQHKKIYRLAADAEDVQLMEKTGAVDRAEISYLLAQINQAQASETIDQALKDVKSILLVKSLIDYPAIWGFFKDKLTQKKFEPYWPTLIEILLLILRGAKTRSDTKTLALLKGAVFPRISEITLTPGKARGRSIEFVDELLPERDKFEQLKIIAEKVMEQGDNVSLLYPLATIYKRQKLDIWKWLYPLIDGDNQKLAKQASELLSYLRVCARNI